MRMCSVIVVRYRRWSRYESYYETVWTPEEMRSNNIPVWQLPFVNRIEQTRAAYSIVNLLLPAREKIVFFFFPNVGHDRNAFRNGIQRVVRHEDRGDFCRVFRQTLVGNGLFEVASKCPIIINRREPCFSVDSESFVWERFLIRRETFNRTKVKFFKFYRSIHW